MSSNIDIGTYFAGKAIQALSSGDMDIGPSVKLAWEISDAMILEKRRLDKVEQEEYKLKEFNANTIQGSS